MRKVKVEYVVGVTTCDRCGFLVADDVWQVVKLKEPNKHGSLEDLVPIKRYYCKLYTAPNEDSEDTPIDCEKLQTDENDKPLRCAQCRFYFPSNNVAQVGQQNKTAFDKYRDEKLKDPEFRKEYLAAKKDLDDPS